MGLSRVPSVSLRLRSEFSPASTNLSPDVPRLSGQAAFHKPVVFERSGKFPEFQLTPQTPVPLFPLRLRIRKKSYHMSYNILYKIFCSITLYLALSIIGLAEMMARLQAVATRPYEVNRARKFEVPATFFKVCQTIDMYLSMLRRVNRNIDTNILIIFIELSKAQIVDPHLQ